MKDYIKSIDIVKLYGDTITVHKNKIDVIPKNYKNFGDQIEVKIDIDAKPKVGDLVCGYLYDDDIYIYKMTEKKHVGQLKYDFPNYLIK